MTDKSLKEILLSRKEDGDLLTLKGGPMHLLISGRHSGGSVAAWHDEVPPNGALPLHIHHRSDELFYILEGRFRFQAGTTAQSMDSGAFIFIPRGVPHAYRNIGSNSGRLFGLVTPAGLENFYIAQSQIPPEQMNRDIYTRMAENFDFEIVGPEL